MDNIRAISSAFEMALRILLLLSEVKNRSLTITQICEIDLFRYTRQILDCWTKTCMGMELTDLANF